MEKGLNGYSMCTFRFFFFFKSKFLPKNISCSFDSILAQKSHKMLKKKKRKEKT